MTFTATVVGTGFSFACEPGVTILDAADAAGLELPYSCRKGVCGNCKGEVVSGRIDSLPGGDALSAAEAERGCALFCRAVPCSDVEIRTPQIRRKDPNARKTVDAKVHRVARAADDVSIIALRFPAGTRVKFRAGQYLEVLLEDGHRRAFSMANPPHQNDGAELHVRHVAGGLFTERVLPSLQAGDRLRVELPFGNFHLNDERDDPAILVASGTGFAPMKSILEAAFRAKSQRRFVLYWGARRRKDLYLAELPLKWQSQHPNFSFVPVLSEPAPQDQWTGRIGLVHRIVMEDYPMLQQHEIYACGVPAMVNAARRDFCEACGLAPDAFHCDAFASPSGV
ncbi:MAG TPA: 2Fe-2S iron-sulfur cluster-binding protein [Burkholderiaceae bacterium]|nr:2Fe-2S iron-sulfur cluster-binding protein [Burkholderiaceae bacterium]